MTGFLKKLLQNDKIRYLIAGGCTTLVNFVSFFLLRTFTKLDRNLSNVIAISLAIAFAYFANKFFVFQSKTKGASQAVAEAASFVGARLVSMLVEVLGFAILCDSFRFHEATSKVGVQFVVLVLNYIFSKLFVFGKERKSLKERILEDYCYILPFVIVSIVMLAVCIAEQVAPFGTHSLALIDSLHQYVPFFSEYRDKLLHERSLFHTWNVALGSNFVSLASYYLASPFNYLFLLADKDHIIVVLDLIIILKVALSASFMAYFLVNKSGEKKNNPMAIAIALCYAFSNYVIGYNWNMMWLDCIMVFPLLILGFERLMKEKDPKLYTLSLFYCLYCNYYIGYIICIFLVLWFFVYEHEGIKELISNGLRFALYSLAGGLMAGFILLPAYFGIMATASANSSVPEFSWYGNFYVLLKQMLFLSTPITNQNFDGGVNLYCGAFAIFAFLMYLANEKNSIYTKVGRTFILIFLMVSFNSTTLNYIWHGMHDQYGIPNRFSFLFIFVMLVIAYEVLLKIKKTKLWVILFAATGSLVFLISCSIFAEDGMLVAMVLATAGMIAVYTVLCILYHNGKMSQKLFRIWFTGVCCVELVVAGAYGLANNGASDYNYYYESSPSVTKAYSKVREIAKEKNEIFYRAELMDSTTLDEASWHNMPSVGTFGSTVLGEVVTTMGRLGFYTGANEFLYMGSTPLTNSILGVRYLLEREGDLNNFAFDYVDTVDGVGIYENPYPLSIGFGVSDAIKDWDRDGALPIDNQNSLAYYMVGGVDIFNPAYSALSVTSENCTAYVEGSTIHFTPDNKSQASFMLTFNVNRAGDYYVNCRGNYTNNIKFYVNGEKLADDRYQIQIFHLGELKEDDYIAIEYSFNNIAADESTASFYMGTFDEVAYEYVYGELAKNQLAVENFEDGYVKGKISLLEGQTMFTSIPYDSGWKVYVDGKETDYYSVMGAFLGVDMEPGEHEIEMKYVPRGLYPGILASVLGLFILLMGVMHNSNKKHSTDLVENTNMDIDQQIIL